MTPVTVDADDLERLVRLAHVWLPDEPWCFDTAPYRCHCGWIGDGEQHPSHAEYAVREALNGRAWV